ncbi:cytochrome P460 family protein (plasmid) [Mesorhizobium sp. AR10]|uniref:cytochrome P460 family protein n=1 Tax=Mesorhizobium sp. AR10 TaxID=2865839 RepID=UPI00215DF76E|nr:cytochrome P460 family protein [Mesorhizobium sp. AR10]UVK35732.1 cytochrome P460 family protein [Mesorhizobium sp. AR10]
MVARALAIQIGIASLLIGMAGSATAQTAPTYDASGNLVLPPSYENWVFVGSNLGLAYKSGAAAMTALEATRADSQVFHNIYIDPTAYAAFVKTGVFPDPTILIMENYAAEDKDSGGVLNGGTYNGNRVRVEAAVKDSHRPTRPDSKEVWAYYSFSVNAAGQPAPATSAFPDAACYSCHKLHAGHDNVWVQFYPQLRRWIQP